MKTFPLKSFCVTIETAKYSNDGFLMPHCHTYQENVLFQLELFCLSSFCYIQRDNEVKHVKLSPYAFSIATDESFPPQKKQEIIMSRREKVFLTARKNSENS
jgi:hypothetical protein